MIETHFLNLPCLERKHGGLSLLATTTVGPRVLGLLVDGVNLLAELPHDGITHPSGAQFTFYGGHRFWYAPEIAAITYLPDNEPVMVEESGDEVRFIQQPEPGTGMQKTLTVRPGQDGFLIGHVLTNLGDRPVSCAPWAITQLKPGGTAILPQAGRIPGWSEYQPNRAVVLWPYTAVSDPRLVIGERVIFVRAAQQAQPLKIGAPNPSGWLAYHLDGLLFVKYAAFDPDAAYFDLGASSQVYSRPDFIELETLGPKVRLAPGESTTHVETWQVFRDVDFDGTEAGAAALARTLNL